MADAEDPVPEETAPEEADPGREEGVPGDAADGEESEGDEAALPADPATGEDEGAAEGAEGRNEKEEDPEAEMLANERDVLKRLIAEREMYDYLMGDLQKLRRSHKYIDKTSRNNSRTERLKSEIHKLHLQYQEYEEYDESPDFELAAMRYELTKVTTENDALQRSIDGSRVDVLREELKELDENTNKLHRIVMEDRIQHALMMQQLSNKYLKRLQEIKETGVKLSNRKPQQFMDPNEEAEHYKEEMERWRYLDDLHLIRARQSQSAGRQRKPRDERRHSSREPIHDEVRGRPPREPISDEHRNEEMSQIRSNAQIRNMLRDEPSYPTANPYRKALPQLEQPTKDEKRKKKFNPGPRPSREDEEDAMKPEVNSEHIDVCEDYQRGRCKFYDDHYVTATNERPAFHRHVCSRCLRRRRLLNKHPSESKLCDSREHGFESASTPTRIGSRHAVDPVARPQSASGMTHRSGANEGSRRSSRSGSVFVYQ